MAAHDQQAVRQLLDTYLEAYRTRDIDLLGTVVAQDEQFVAFGTDRNETWHGWLAFREHLGQLFNAVQSIDWGRGNTTVRFSKEGTVSWFTEELSGDFVVADQKHQCTFRLSGVAELRDDAWKLVQFHRSCATPEFAVPYLNTHGVRFD